MAAPAMTFGTANNVQANASLGALASSAAVTVDASTKFELQLQFTCTFGTVAGTAGLQINIFPIVAGGTTADNNAGAGSFVLPAVTSTTQTATVKLGPGRYSITMKNLDGTNGVTNANITSATVDSIS